jgi:hypothetical protein
MSYKQCETGHAQRLFVDFGGAKFSLVDCNNGYLLETPTENIAFGDTEFGVATQEFYDRLHAYMGVSDFYAAYEPRLDVQAYLDAYQRVADAEAADHDDIEAQYDYISL